MVAKISLYKGTKEGLELYIVESPFRPKQGIPEKDNSLFIEDLNQAIRGHISAIKENGWDYAGLIRQKPSQNNGYVYSDADEHIFKQAQEANPAEVSENPFAKYGCTVTVGEKQNRLVPVYVK